MSVLHSLKKSFLSRLVRFAGAMAIVVALIAISQPIHNVSKVMAAPATVIAYVSSENGHYSHTINTDTKSWGTSVGDFQPTQNNWRCQRMANTVNRAGTKVYNVASCQGNSVAINTATNTFSILPFAGTAFVPSSDDQFMYVVTGYYRFKYKLSDNSVVWQVTSPGFRPYATSYTFGISQDDSKMYVPMQDVYQEVGVLDTATGATLSVIKNSAWSSPAWTVAAPVGNKIYVGTNQGIAVINSITDSYTTLLPVTSGPPIAVSPDGNTFFATSGGSIKKVSASDGTVLASYAVDTGEGGMALTPDGTALYAVTNSGVSIIRLSDGNITNLTFPSTSIASRGRTIVMVQPMAAPDISLSSLTGTASTNNAVSGLYSISNSGDLASSFSITPALPAGLSFSTSTGLISGTPTSVSSRTSYTITAVNAAGTSAKVFSLAVELAAGLTPMFSAVVARADGFTFSINNSSANYTYSGIATNGGSVSISGSSVTVTGLTAGTSSTVIITATRNGYADASATISGSATSATTTTVAPTTTTTVVVQTTTTVAATPVVPTTVAVSETPVVTVPQGQASVGTIAPSVGPTTTVLNPMRLQAPQTTTTSIPPVVENAALPPTAVAAVAPVAPALTPGTAGALIGGKTVAATVSRASNQITAIGGGITTTISGLTSDGQRVALNTEGNLVVNEGDKLVVDAAGYSPGADVSVWLYSSPTRLGVIAADSNGKVSGSFDLPSELEVGDHRLVLSGDNPDGVKALLGLGLSYGSVESGSSITRVLIAIPIALAILFGLFLPAVARRRRQNNAVASY